MFVVIFIIFLENFYFIYNGQIINYLVTKPVCIK